MNDILSLYVPWRLAGGQKRKEKEEKWSMVLKIYWGAVSAAAITPGLLALEMENWDNWCGKCACLNNHQAGGFLSFFF